MLIRNDINGATMQYALGLCVLAIFCYGVFYFIRKRAKRRDSLYVDIPSFLVGGNYSSNNGTSDTKLDRTEVYPCPKV